MRPAVARPRSCNDSKCNDFCRERPPRRSASDKRRNCAARRSHTAFRVGLAALDPPYKKNHLPAARAPAARTRLRLDRPAGVSYFSAPSRPFPSHLIGTRERTFRFVSLTPSAPERGGASARADTNMKRIAILTAILIALGSAGCCRMCCWQRGGSFHNGYCYPAMPAPAAAPGLQPVPQQTYAQPCACQ